MLTERFEAATAVLRVGCEIPSQLRREYSRLFGATPLLDIMDLRQMSPSNEAVRF